MNELAKPASGSAPALAEMRGQHAARFEREVLPYMDRMYPAALRLTRSHADAEDLIQETFARAYAGFARFQPGSSLAGWLHRILYNTFVTSYRKRQRQPRRADVIQMLNREWAIGEGDPVPLEESAEAAVMAHQPDARVRMALQTLSRDVRTAVYLADVEGYAYQEIADLTGTPIGTVRSQLHRGRRRLRDLLLDQTSSDAA